MPPRKRLLATNTPLAPVSPAFVAAFVAADDLFDDEGDALPKEKMLFVDLADGRRFAVRPSGTEPKIKFYLFGSAAKDLALDQAKIQVKSRLEALWAWIEKDAASRLVVL
jgi:phosphoglucomutase